MQIASVPYVTRSARVQVDVGEGPVVDNTQPVRRSRHVGEPGYVRVCYPAGQIRWVHKTKTANMAMREFGTQSDHAYIIAKHPSEVDEEWRGRNGGSPGHNPLQLSGVPDSTVAGSSTILPRREEDDSALSSTARQGSTLFHDRPDATVSSALGVSFSDYVGHAGADDGPVAGPSTVRGSGSRENDALGFDASFHPHPGQSTTARPVIQTTIPAQTLSQPSPATSWGEESYRPSRRSSLSLHLNTFPSPRGSQRFSVSVEQLSINEFIGGGPVPVDVVADNASVPSRRSEDSREHDEFGLPFNSREGSSRHVVSGVQDLEDINHSLSQVSDPPQEDARSTRASRSSRSSRQSRQPSISGHEPEAIIGPRTGLALYGSGPAAHSSSGRPSADPSLASVPFPPNPRSPSRVSTRSRAESTQSHSSSGHSAGSHRSLGHRPRRSSAATSAHLRERFEAPPNSWAAEPGDTQPYTSRGPYGDSHAQASQDCIPRSLGSMESLGLGGIGGIGGVGGSGLMLTFEAPSTSAAVDRNGQAAAGIHAPRPLSSRHSSLVNVAWNSRNGH
ncbi:hypothetical protein BD413DRAFT_467209 [Trametes elegans]|nr:hypothetical protein BD413DRAFT_467209 [Trametes elegans]